MLDITYFTKMLKCVVIYNLIITVIIVVGSITYGVDIIKYKYK